MTPTTAAPVTLAGWRHHDQRVAHLPGIALPPLPVPSDVDSGTAVRELFDRGARRVVLAGTVDLAGSGDVPAAVRALTLVRDLTSHGIVVDWRLRLPAGEERWPLLNHLHPPAEVLAGPDRAAGDAIRQEWTGSFYPGKCVYRHGPGFLQVRDRRGGELNRLTIDEPEYVEAVGRLLDGATAADEPGQVLDDLAGEGLTWELAGTVLWLPYRVRRWPWPSMLV